MTDLAQRLLDAQVRFHLQRLDPPALEATVRRVAGAVLDAGEAPGAPTLAEVVDAEALRALVRRSLRTVPGSAAVAGILDLATDVAAAGPEHPHLSDERADARLSDVVPRERVEALLDAVLAAAPLAGPALDAVAASPLVGALAARFMARVVGEAMTVNRAAAEKVPGLGSLFSLGTAAASRMAGAAGGQFDALLGEGSALGAGLRSSSTFAARRLNRIVLDTLADPATREAVLQAWDLAAARPLTGPSPDVDLAGVREVVSAGHALAVDVLATEEVAALADAVVTAFLDRFGQLTPAALLADLGIDRTDVVDDLVALAPGVLRGLRETGDLERIVRAELEPFYASPEVAALLDGPG